MIHFSVQQKLTQHCKAIIFQLKLVFLKKRDIIETALCSGDNWMTLVTTMRKSGGEKKRRRKRESRREEKRKGIPWRVVVRTLQLGL